MLPRNLILLLIEIQHKNHNLLIARKPFQNVAKFKYLGTTPTNQKYIREEIQGMLVATLFRSEASLFPSPLQILLYMSVKLGLSH
jgi:hypothetical protein